MQEETRRAIANAVLPKGEDAARALFSQTANAWTNFSFTREGFFDHGAAAHIARVDGGFYHHGLGAHVLLEVDGSQFRGFDHGSGRHFNGVVQGATAIVYDVEAQRHHLYKLG